MTSSATRSPTGAQAQESLLPEVATPSGRAPSLAFSVLSLLALAALLGTGLLWAKVPLPLMMAIGFGGALTIAAVCRVSYQDAEGAALDLVRKGLPPLLIFVAVGALISSWIHSGTVPAMIYYGMQLISPAWFLPTALILCAITSLVNGTNFATVATIGLALMGVASALGIPLGIAAGAIICGAIFGDKMSPLSDTTVMTPGLSGVRLFTHIRHMMWTTVPAIVISLVAFTIIGLQYGQGSGVIAEVASASAGLREAFNIGLIPLLPPVFVLVLLVLKVEAFPAISLGALAGIPIAVWHQGSELTVVMDSLWNGYTAPEGLGATADLLAGGESGGALKLLGLASIVIFALGIAGALGAAGVMQTLLGALESRLDGPKKLVPATLLITTLFNLIGGAVNFAASNCQDLWIGVSCDVLLAS